ncbi:ATP-binding cassette domain-containing protein [Olivibacter sp. SDN3]|uniref:ABC transporter ATP-binding protein n=1 Tax=Olivibacter sp. SDN3 TaxID=2764720 RepID=UPI0016514BF3|nr:ATP-binding cassette domain-containing protein [Olivibacter sp. SDN3]QNL51494.1 ATP-binding cassette domain-containing protein [Olivibacter sp. SDN3]
MSLTVTHVTKKYGKDCVVNDISFDLRNNEVVGFLGPNGAGKSTIMKMITGYLRPDKGVIRVNGMDVRKETLEVKKLIGYLPENNPQYADMYVVENLQFLADIHQINDVKKRINDVLEAVGFMEEKRKKIKQLSKGYRQRLGIAQALLHNPPILILDEPTSGLDPNQLQGIRQLIRKLGKEKLVIFSTHIMQEVEAVCESVMMINKGEIVAGFPLNKMPELFDGKGLEAIFSELTS